MATGTDPYVAFLEAKLATELGPHEAQELTQEGKAILLDVRSAESRAKGHIPGSLHIPRRELANRLTELPKGKVIVAYCSDLGCQASLKATIEMRKNGLDARHMVGGYKFWTEKGYPTASQAPQKGPLAVAKSTH
jgi:rhodanese-related sulfurtransferase